MRTWILTTTQDLLPQNSYSGDEVSLTLDEVAACAGISLAHLRAHYTSVYAIRADVRRSSRSGRTSAPVTAGGC